MHFVIFASPLDYHRYSYSDLFDSKNVEYVTKRIRSNSRIINALFKLHTSKKTNRFIKWPFKRIWFNQLCNFNRSCNDYCFVFFVGTTWYNMIENGFISYLKKKYKKSKFVCFWQDLVKRNKQALEVCRKEGYFDAVYSFDYNDCADYGFRYHGLVYSNKYKMQTCSIKNDIYFVGLAKDRLHDIQETFYKLKSKGLMCDFHVVGAREEEKEAESGIDYCDSIPYDRNLEMISQSRAILEIMQKDGSGFTLRTCEAIMFDKMLITDNNYIQKAPFYSSENIVNLADIDSFDWDTFKKKTIFDHKYKEKLSPLLFIKEIESDLQNN